MNKFETMDIGDMQGKVIVKIDGGNTDDDVVTFTTADGYQFMFYHEHDCCESVAIEDVCGDLNDLLNYPILLAEEVSNADEPDCDNKYESYTWTFYKFSTVKGSVTIRWLGTSNGYYSESVNLRVTKLDVN